MAEPRTRTLMRTTDDRHRGNVASAASSPQIPASDGYERATDEVSP
jgi:hypothetical protein